MYFNVNSTQSPVFMKNLTRTFTEQVEIIQTRRAALLKESPPTLPEKALKKRCETYFSETTGSRELFEQAEQVFPEGVQHHNTFVAPYPLFIKHALGSKVYDVDGNEYIDWTMGAGAKLFGHNPLHEVEVHQALDPDCFPLFHHPEEIELAQKVIGFMSSVELIKFFQSGTEAVQAAIRLARAERKRDMIVKVAGGYHGWMSPLIRDIRLPGTDTLFMPGVPKQEANQCLSVMPNDLDMLHRKIKRHNRRIAGVIVELPGPESGRIPLFPDFVHEIESLCRKHELLFILDETVSGFRLGTGGAQAAYALEPDLTILGKILGGGASLSAVGGRQDLINYFSRNVTRFVKKKAVYVGGTMTANRLATGLGLGTLKAIEEKNPYPAMDENAAQLVYQLNALFRSAGQPFFAYHFGSIVQIELVGWPSTFSLRRILDIRKRLSAIEQHQLFLQSEGILSLSGTRFFLSHAHSVDDISHLIRGYERLLDFIK
jgi:glutamate-1-semialdehyde 2,1-aminomutase